VATNIAKQVERAKQKRNGGAVKGESIEPQRAQQYVHRPKTADKNHKADDPSRGLNPRRKRELSHNIV
jgi:hypothetical protein